VNEKVTVMAYWGTPALHLLKDKLHMRGAAAIEFLRHGCTARLHGKEAPQLKPVE